MQQGISEKLYQNRYLCDRWTDDFDPWTETADLSGNGLPHDELAAQIVEQASLGDGENEDEPFAVVFAAMGVKYDVAEYFKRRFAECGVSDHVAMFLNLSNDPVAERLITPKVALTAAEYLAFEKICISL